MSSTRNAARELLLKVYGYTSFRGEQAEIVEHVVSGRNAFVLMPTGGGKSLCYQIPSLLRPGVGVIVSPLIALMQDQVDALKQLGFARRRSIPTWRVGISPGRSDVCGRRELDLLYVAPERLADGRFSRFAGGVADSAFRHRRGALRVAMGARFSSALRAAWACWQSGFPKCRASR